MPRRPVVTPMAGNKGGALVGARRAAFWVVIDTLVVVYALLPVLWILSLSLKPTSTVRDGRLIPTTVTFDNYRGIFRGKLQQTPQFHLIEIQQQLARFRVHVLAIDLDPNFFAVREQLQFGQRIFNVLQLFRERQQRAFDLQGRHAIASQLHQRAQCKQFQERVQRVMRDQLLIFPALQAALRNADEPSRLFARIRLLGCGSWHGY